MQPPAATPLIQGSSTPSANEVATAASTASPPAASTDAPTSAARRCADATTPASVAITVLRTTCELEKLSIVVRCFLRLRSESGVGFGVPHHVGMRGEPHGAQALGVADQFLED